MINEQVKTKRPDINAKQNIHMTLNYLFCLILHYFTFPSNNGSGPTYRVKLFCFPTHPLNVCIHTASCLLCGVKIGPIFVVILRLNAFERKQREREKKFLSSSFATISSFSFSLMDSNVYLTKYLPFCMRKISLLYTFCFYYFVGI